MPLPSCTWIGLPAPSWVMNGYGISMVMVMDSPGSPK
jgi:hypothetical protein